MTFDDDGPANQVLKVRNLVETYGEILLDEITSALDPELVGEVLELVGELAGSGVTIVMATHEIGFARHVAHKACFLDGGLLVEAGPAA
ncbi:MAG: hypothetical protein ACSLE6_04410 [Mycobacterium sp.]